MVWVDDKPAWVQNKINKYFSHCKIDRYEEPVTFLEDVIQYPFDTKIILDMYYTDAGIYDITGFTVAKQLHDMGYVNLYMLAGEPVKQNQIPDYLILILKDDEDKLAKLNKK